MPTPTFTLNLSPHQSRHATRLLKKGKPWSKPRFGRVPWRSLGIRVAVIGVLFAFVASSAHFYGVGRVEGIKRAEALAYEQMPPYDLTIKELQGILEDGGWSVQSSGAYNTLKVGKHGVSFLVDVGHRGFMMVYKHDDHGTLPFKAVNEFNASFRWASLSRTSQGNLELRLEVMTRGGLMPNTIHNNLRAFHALIDEFNGWVVINKESDWGGDFAISGFNMADLTTLLDRDEYQYEIVDGRTVLITIKGKLIAISPIKDLGFHLTFKFLDFGVLSSDHLNRWNERKPWTALSRWNDNSISLKRDVIVEGGVTENNMSANLAAFQVMIDELIELVDIVRVMSGRKLEKI